jgi:hypothetical protein
MVRAQCYDPAAAGDRGRRRRGLTRAFAQAPARLAEDFIVLVMRLLRNTGSASTAAGEALQEWVDPVADELHDAPRVARAG